MVMIKRNLIWEYIVADKLLSAPFFLLTSKEYLDNVKEFYLASVESADFVNAAEESRKMINSWVERQTNGTV